MNMKLLGGILLIVGTAIGGGMLALPIATSQLGFLDSTLLLLFCWFLMTAGAFLILEVNLWLPQNTNLISMAHATLGKPGEIISWITYLLLLYSLLAAYIAGGGDFIRNLIDLSHITLPSWVSSVLFTSILGYVVFKGISSVDFVNRIFMLIKFTTFFLLIFLIIPRVNIPYLDGGQLVFITSSLTVAITSFGFATIVPSLRTYFADDVKKLRRAILIGSLIPLACYILWDLAVMGVIPRDGQSGLIAILHSGRSTSEFVNELSLAMQRSTISTCARIFTSICLFTSFLGVALCLFDFLFDGLKRPRTYKNAILIAALTFLPPLAIVLIYPGIFITALAYAGIYCVILLVLLPALMAYSGRYIQKYQASYKVFGGKFLIIALIIISGLLLLQSIMALV